MDEIVVLVELVNNPVATLLVVIVTGLRGLWVFGWIYRERIEQANTALRAWQDEAERWRGLAIAWSTQAQQVTPRTTDLKDGS